MNITFLSALNYISKVFQSTIRFLCGKKQCGKKILKCLFLEFNRSSKLPGFYFIQLIVTFEIFKTRNWLYVNGLIKLHAYGFWVYVFWNTTYFNVMWIQIIVKLQNNSVHYQFCRIKRGRYRHPDLYSTICVVQLCNSLNFAPIKTFLETSFIQLPKWGKEGKTLNSFQTLIFFTTNMKTVKFVL